MYKKGLIYKGNRITNWCSRCRTALSDLEVKFRGEQSSFYYLKYPLEDGSGHVTIATTRPETMLGDTAVAVNPNDERFSHLIGKNVKLPIVDRLIPVIGDEAVDMEFGTGALKVTPGHDPADFDIGQRHSLAFINILNNDGTLNENAGSYEGQDRLEARQAIVDQLDRELVLETIEPYSHSVGHCERCDEIVEPLVSEQWYVRMEPLAKPARASVDEGRIRIVPERFDKIYFNWLDNIRDWCISRQLWWGHRIPVWYCDECGEHIVEMEDPTKCPKCASSSLHRDLDVLDTWFSSALWTHSTLGWPEQTEDLDYFYPTAVMETGHDILFFWVARMIFSGLFNMQEEPFHTVYLHGMVLDPSGVKMSKVRGNVLDPLEIIDLYGADAVRFALTTGTAPGNNMRMNEGKLEASRNFANKLWNASRYVMSNLEKADSLEGWEEVSDLEHREDRWIVSRLNKVAQQVDQHMQEYQFGEAQTVVHDFLWNEYCDWYIEMSKIRIRAEESPSPLPVLAHVLERVLRLLHPFLPFVTEEIWQALGKILPHQGDKFEALVVAEYPNPDSTKFDDDAEQELDAVVELTRAARNVRAMFRIQNNEKIPARINTSEQYLGVFADSTPFIESESGITLSLTSETNGSGSAGNEAAQVITAGTLSMSIGDLVDIEEEKSRLKDELNELTSYRRKISGRLSNEQFLSKAPQEVVDRDKERLEDADARASRLTDILERLSE
jgi:valyl-tRNA synthetase